MNASQNPIVQENILRETVHSTMILNISVVKFRKNTPIKILLLACCQ